MISILTNLLLISATLAAPALDIEARVDKVLSVTFNNILAGASYRDTDTFSAVSGVLTIPTTLVVIDDHPATAWVGLGGHSCGSTFQTGLDFHFVDGKPSYSAWFKITDDPTLYSEQYSDPIDIEAGDAVRLSVRVTNPNKGIAMFENLTRHLVVSRTFHSPTPSLFCERDAEWMATVPGNPIGFNITFSEAVATTHNGPIGPNGDSVLLLALLRNDGEIFPSVDSSNVHLVPFY